MKALLLLTFLSLTFIVSSQQIPQYSQWYMNQFEGNPAHAGIKRCVDAHVLFRNQWTGFEGAPKSGFLTMSIPLYTQRKKYMAARHGTGFKFERDQIGQFSVSRLNIAYAAHFNFSEHRRLSLGIYGGVVQMGFNPTTIHSSEPDPAVYNEAALVAPDASFGAWFNDENYFIGFAAQNLIPLNWEGLGLDTKTRPHFSLTAGYRLSWTEKMSLIPALKVRVPSRGKVSADLNIHWDYDNKIGLGVGYRNTDAVLFFISIKIASQFALVYSFDYTLSDIQKGAKNTHEISLRFSTCKIKKSSTSSCPLF